MANLNTPRFIIIINMNELLQFCETESQRKYINALIEHGSQRAAANALGCSKGTISGIVKTVKRNAAKRGYNPDADMTKPAPEGFIVKGTSTLYDGDGNIKQQWVKTHADLEQQNQMFLSAIEEIASGIPRFEFKEPTLQSEESHKLMNLFTLTDYHLGMMAWGLESGTDWNTKISEEMFYKSINRMVKQSPPAAIGVLNLQGDFLHTDMMEAVTPTNHHSLDTDVRFPQLIEVAVRSIKYAVNEMLETHGKVILLIAQGNHDIASTHWLQMLFKMYYENTTKVEVIVHPNPYYCIEHGQTMLVVHHGHRADTGKLSSIAAGLFPKQWGNTAYRYAHTGHRHHKVIRENFGIIVEQHQTLAPKDAYSAHGGYIAERGASVITYHSEMGEVSRVTVRP